MQHYKILEVNYERTMRKIISERLLTNHEHPPYFVIIAYPYIDLLMWKSSQHM